MVEEYSSRTMKAAVAPSPLHFQLAHRESMVNYTQVLMVMIIEVYTKVSENYA